MCEHTISFLLGHSLEVGLLSHIVDVWCKTLPDCSKVVVLFCTPTRNVWEFASKAALGIVSCFILAILRIVVSWYLIVALSCVSLMTNCILNIFSCSLLPDLSLLWWSVHIYIYIFFLLFLKLEFYYCYYYWVVRVLYTFWIPVLYQNVSYKYFLSVYGLFLHLFSVSFEEEKF